MLHCSIQLNSTSNSILCQDNCDNWCTAIGIHAHVSKSRSDKNTATAGFTTPRPAAIDLDEIASMIRQGRQVQVVDGKTGEDLTRVTLRQIITRFGNLIWKDRGRGDAHIYALQPPNDFEERPVVVRERLVFV